MIADFIRNALSNVASSGDKKLTIIPMSDVGNNPQQSGPAYVAQFNPEQYEMSEQLVIVPRKPRGEWEPETTFDSSAGETFNVELLIDGTGAAGDGNSRVVSTDIDSLRKTIGYNGSLHQPNFVILVWGDLIRTAVVIGYTIKYTLFKADGTPLRARVNINFRKHVPKTVSVKEAKLSSPDLTHLYMVREGDRLDLICQKHYNDMRYYIPLARFNNLTNLRELTPGQQIFLPPVQK